MKGFARYPPARALSLAEGLEIAAGARLLPNQGKSDNSAINTIKRHKGDLSTMGFSISYAPLWQTLKDRGLKKIDLVRLNIITPAALKKMEKNRAGQFECDRQNCRYVGRGGRRRGGVCARG